MADSLVGNLEGLAQQRIVQRHGRTHGEMLNRRSALDALRSGTRSENAEATRAALREASKEFEALFLNQMISAMRKTVGEGSFLNKSQGEKIFEGMLDEEWGRRMAGRHGPGGLAEVLYQQLSRQMGLDPTVGSDETEAAQTELVERAQHWAQGVIAESGSGTHPLLQMPTTPPAGLLDISQQMADPISR
ncbi:MAG: rod-binding protein [Candidatus Latescibacterota bacterium]|nr:rod-binding protein [Candidatus Latescibacterota bacterium]